MRHPTDGTLRRLLDEPAGVADTDREHIAGCPVCLSGLAAARADAEVAAAALSVEVATDVDEGWRRLTATASAPGRAVAGAGHGVPWRARLRSPIVAALAAVAILAGAGAAAAANWLPIFRAERVAPVTVAPADLVALPDLSAYGSVAIAQAPKVRRVEGADAARKATGLPVPVVGALPRGVTGEPSYQVGDRASAVFTFSADKAARTAESVGKPLPPPPAGLATSRFRLTAGPGVAVVWPEARGVPALMVARVVAPRVYSEGIPFATARDYLLSLPGLPEAVASQLRAISATATTLPLIVQAGLETSFTTDVGGATATVLAARDGSTAGVIWVADGFITAVGGTLSTDEVLSVARGLRWDR